MTTTEVRPLHVKDIAAWNARARIVAVFHTNAGHVTLHDQAYDHERMIATGNPYKKLIADLMKRGWKLNSVAQLQPFTSGEMQTFFPESKLTRMLCPE